MYLSWRDESFEDFYGPALILRNAVLLHALKSTRTLRELCISYGQIYIENLAVRNCWFRIKGFRELTSLEIYDFYGDHDRLIKDIAHVLCDSAGLKKLG